MLSYLTHEEVILARSVPRSGSAGTALWAIIAIGFVQGLFYAWNAVMTSDQEQMLTKGIRLAFLGEWEHYGNLVTGGGNVPGSLTSLVVGLPLMIVDSAMSPQVLVGLLQLAGLLIILRVLKEYFSPVQIVVFCGLFWLSPWRASKAILWNPSYLILVTALHLYSFHRLQRRPRGFWPSFLNVIALGIGLQLHPSAAVLGLLSMVLLLRRALPLNRVAAGLALLAVLASLAPWFAAVSGGAGLAPVVDEARGNFYYGFNLLHPFSFLKGVMYWVRYTSMVFPHYIFSNLDYSRFGAGGMEAAVRVGFESLRWAFGGTSVFLALWAFGWHLRRFWKRRLRCADPLEHYVLAGIAAMVLLVMISPAELSHWHLYPLLPVATIALCRFLFERFNRVPRWAGLVLFCVVVLYFVLFNVMANVTAPNYYSPEQNMRSDYQALKSSFGVR